MPIFLPEKVFINTLAAGLVTIKADLPGYIPDIFDTDYFSQVEINTITEFVTSTRISIMQGYPLDDQKLPGWFIVPATSSDKENFIGGYGNDEDILQDDTDGDEINAKLNNYSVKIITASLNGDVTIWLDAIARYIVLLARESLSALNINELTIQSTDFDPSYQFLPQHLMMRSSLITFDAFDTWKKRFPLITDAILYGKFNPNEEYIEIRR